MDVIIFDTNRSIALQPLTFTRPMGALRCGILTINEKWEYHFKGYSSYLTAPHLAAKYPSTLNSTNTYIAGDVLPTKELAEEIKTLPNQHALMASGRLIAIKGNADVANAIIEQKLKLSDQQQAQSEVVYIDHTYHLIVHNKAEIKNDFALITQGRVSQPISETVTIVGGLKNPLLRQHIFIEEGAEVEYAMLNPSEGPIYIGKNSKIMEGAMVRGPFSLGESSQISMGAKIYGGTTIGPWSKAGGEISNSIISGYSNKVHDGYLGDSVIGEWCNLGADTNTSNLKNDYAHVKLWNYDTERFEKTGLQFCGLIMGDYSRCAINTSFNTGTVVGIGANIYGSGFPRNFIPSFTIGGSQGLKENSLKAVQDIANTAMKRRAIDFTSTDANIMKQVFDATAKYRTSLK